MLGPVSQNLKSVAAFLSQTSFCPVDGLKVRQINSVEDTRPNPIALVITGPYLPDGHQGLWSPNLIENLTFTDHLEGHYWSLSILQVYLVYFIGDFMVFLEKR